MTVTGLATAALVLGTLLATALYVRAARRREGESVSVLERSLRESLAEPASLHPVIDPSKCIGCGSCVEACPEKEVLGLVDGRAQLIGPSHCIGHGACRTACPSSAITLVFGTETRGVDIPLVSASFETNVPGIFIAGELGGMGLIRNAFEQGRQAVEAIRRLDGIGSSQPLDVVIVGAGPAGFSASLAAKQAGLRFVTLEQDSLGGTVAHYPRGKIVMTVPGRLPLIGKVPFTETSKEKLIEFLQAAERDAGIAIRYRERVESVERNNDGFVVKTHRDSYRSRAVLLAIGRRGTPRRLGVEGEDLPKVTYRLIDPEQYRNRKVLVVGGGDSAIEAAVAVAGAPGASVTLSHRAASFGRAKRDNRRRLEEAEAAGRIRVLLESEVRRIESAAVHLERGGRRIELQNDDVIVCAGGVLPTPFLRTMGIEVETKFGTS
jgi:thioredoxin reductase/Pyruvate/2-oxoacid:ferredoxin oxidoreductase delta subunit